MSDEPRPDDLRPPAAPPAPGSSDPAPPSASDLLGAALGGAAQARRSRPVRGQERRARRVARDGRVARHPRVRSARHSRSSSSSRSPWIPRRTRATSGSAWESRSDSPLVFTIVRLVTKSPPAAAIGGLVAAVAAAALALWTGRGDDNFVPGLHHQRRLRHGAAGLGAHRLVAHRPGGRLAHERRHALAPEQARAGVPSSGSRSRGRGCSSLASPCSCRCTSPTTSRRSEP